MAGVELPFNKGQQARYPDFGVPGFFFLFTIEPEPVSATFADPVVDLLVQQTLAMILTSYSPKIHFPQGELMIPAMMASGIAHQKFLKKLIRRGV